MRFLPLRRPRTVVDLLKREHARLRRELAVLEESTDPAERRALLADLVRDLELHTRLEDEIFYPAFDRAFEAREERMLSAEAKQEHHVVDVLVTELQETDPNTGTFTARAAVLREVVESHLRHEERRLFPLAKREMTRPHLMAMAERIEERRQELGGAP